MSIVLAQCTIMASMSPLSLSPNAHELSAREPHALLWGGQWWCRGGWAPAQGGEGLALWGDAAGSKAALLTLAHGEVQVGRWRM